MMDFNKIRLYIVVVIIILIVIGVLGIFYDDVSRELSYQKDLEDILRNEIVRVQSLAKQWSDEGLQAQRHNEKLKRKLFFSELTVKWYKEQFKDKDIVD